MSKWPRVSPYGDRAYLVEFGDKFDPRLVERARAMALRWKWGPAIPAYTSLVLQYDETHDVAMADARVARLLRTEGSQAAAVIMSPRVIEIPVVYDGPDLADVANMSRTSVERVVELHASREYVAYFLGFMPGWAYCGPLDRRIVATRLERPRERVPAGSVAVVDGQTGVYPYQSPGGWRLIGRTSTVMFDPDRERASLIYAGARVRFVRQ